MKLLHHLLLTLVPAAGLALGGCANVAHIVHEDSIRVAVEAQADATEPGRIQAGYRQRLAVVVPPRNGLSAGKLASGKNVASGDALSTITKIQATRVQANTGTERLIGLHIQTGIYSGLAANAHATGVIPPASAEHEEIMTGKVTDKDQVVGGTSSGDKVKKLNEQMRRIMEPVAKRNWVPLAP